jgi:hypothetical protein
VKETTVTSDDDPGWLTRRLLGDPGLLAEVLAEAREETMLGDLRAREVLAIRLGFDRVRDLTAIDYGHAFRALARAGDDEAARAVAAVGMAAQLLPGHSMEWIARCESRPLTRAQRDALDLAGNGQARRDEPGTLTGPDGTRGIDGAWYKAARFRLRPGFHYDPAVIVTTMAGTAEVVTGFRSEGDRASWLADRTHDNPGPLTSALTGVRSRAGQEELVLAWLLSRPRLDAPAPDGLGPRLFTTHSRAEIFRAWEQAWPGASGDEVAAVLDVRLLVAPDWAAADVGAPGQRTAPAYLRRLAATPVTEARAAAALRNLASEDAALAPPAPPRPPELTYRPARYTGLLLQPPAPGLHGPGTAPSQRP